MSSQQYSEETLQEAVKLVQEESYGEAQKATGVPKTTIYNYNKSIHGELIWKPWDDRYENEL